MNYSGMLFRELKDICRSDAKYAGHSYCTNKAELVEHIIKCNEREIKAQQALEVPSSSVLAPEVAAAGGNSSMAAAGVADEPQTAYELTFPAVVPALAKPATVTVEEYLDDIAMPAPFWSCQITNSLTWGRWRFGEGESKQHGKYLSITSSELGRHWIILWDWNTFEAGCKELIWGLTRLGESAFLPSPGYLPAPPGEDEEPAEGEGDQHPGSDRRRDPVSDRNRPLNIEEVCVNCSGTYLCPGREHNCGCKSQDDCPTLGWCANCDLPQMSLDAAPWDSPQSVGVPV